MIHFNHTELLEEKYSGTLIDQLRTRYGYIFIDCSPVKIVADTAIIEKLADRTLFVVRASLLERSMLPVLETMYEERRLQICLPLWLWKLLIFYGYF